MDHPQFQEVLRSEFDQVDRCRDALRSYFAKSGDRYTGSQFESLCDASHPNEITEKDLVAVQALSVDIPIRAALWILSDEGRSQISHLLSQAPTTTEMWHPEAEELLRRGGPLWTLWELLDAAHWPSPKLSNDLSSTKISKLIATKRPRLSPILDSVIREKVFPKVDNRWEAFRSALSNDDLRTKIIEVTSIPEVPDSVVLMRRIDVVLWMHHHND